MTSKKTESKDESKQPENKDNNPPAADPKDGAPPAEPETKPLTAAEAAAKVKCKAPEVFAHRVHDDGTLVVVTTAGQKLFGKV